MKFCARFLPLFGLIALMLTSCGEHESKSLSYIPEDANAVMVLNVRSLVNKGAFTTPRKYDFLERANKSLKKIRDANLEVLTQTLARPSNSGLVLNHNLYAAHFGKTTDSTGFFVIAEMLNRNTWTEYLKPFLKDYANLLYEYCDTVLADSSNSNFGYADLVGGKYWIWNDEVAMYCNTSFKNKKEAFATFNKLLGKKRTSINSNEGFNTFQAKHQDASIWVDMGFMNQIMAPVRDSASIEIDFKKSYGEAYLNFNEQDVTLDVNVLLNENLKMLLDQTGIATEGFDEELFKYLPNDAHAIYGHSINIGALLKTTLGFVNRSDPSLAIINVIEKQLDTSLADAGASFTGDFAFTIGNLYYEKIIKTRTDSILKEKIDSQVNESTGKMEYSSGMVAQTRTDSFDSIVPNMNIIIGLKNAQWLVDKTDSSMQAMKVKGQPFYKMPIPGYMAYLCMNAEACLITTNKEAAIAFGHGGMENNFASHEKASTIQGSNFFASISLNAQVYNQKMYNILVENRKEQQIMRLQAQDWKTKEFVLKWDGYDDESASKEEKKEFIKSYNNMIELEANKRAASIVALETVISNLELSTGQEGNSAQLKLSLKEQPGNSLENMLMAIDRLAYMYNF